MNKQNNELAVVRLLRGSSAKCAHWTPETTPWSQFQKQLTKAEIGTKDGPAFVPGWNPVGGRRAKETVEQTDMMVLDVDAGDDFNETVFTCGDLLDLDATLYTTFSHLDTETAMSKAAWEAWRAKEGEDATPALFLTEVKGLRPKIAEGAVLARTEGNNVVFQHRPCPRFRVVVRLAKPWRVADYPNRAAAEAAWGRAVRAVAHLLGIQHDARCEDVARLFYLPRVPDKAALEHFRAEVIPGKPLDVFSLPDAPVAANGAAGAAKPTDRRRVPFHREDYPKVKAMLAATENPLEAGRDVAVGIGHALAASLLEDTDLARAIFLEWAARWEGGSDPTEDAHIFDTLRSEHHGDAITLLHHAKRLGVDPAAFDLDIKHYECQRDFEPVDGDAPEVTAHVGAPAAMARRGKKPRLKRGLATSAADLLGLPVPPPRAFVYGRYYQRGVVSLTVGRGGGAKTSLVLTENIAMAANQKLLHEKIHEADLIVLHINMDEPRDELHRRLLATCRAYLMPAAKVQNLHLIGRDDFAEGLRLLTIDPTTRQAAVNTEAVVFLEKLINDLKADVVVIDPIGNTLEGGENDNPTVHQLMGELSRLAEAKDVALHLVHHSRKTGAGGAASGLGADDTRGAGAWINAARSVRTVSVMDQKAATNWGVPADERFRHHGIDASAKSNYTLPADALDWIRLNSVDLQNAQGRLPSDSIGVPHVWTQPKVVVDEARIAAILRHIRDGFPAKGGGTGLYTAAANSTKGRSSLRVLLKDSFGIASKPQRDELVDQILGVGGGAPLAEEKEQYCGHAKETINRLAITKAGEALVDRHGTGEAGEAEQT